MRIIIFVGIVLQHACQLLTMLSSDGRLSVARGVGTCFKTTGHVASLILNELTTPRSAKIFKLSKQEILSEAQTLIQNDFYRLHLGFRLNDVGDFR
ncbi:MAG: hypothetical protein GY818_18630 [Planctomycetaceae bacterium]|nr:hypothetical protein [Planctomycetaceae bacterium]